MKKAHYLKPTIEDLLASSSDIMITASVDATKIVEDGGNTSEYPITEGDSRRRHSVWSDDDFEVEE